MTTDGKKTRAFPAKPCFSDYDLFAKAGTYDIDAITIAQTGKNKFRKDKFEQHEPLAWVRLQVLRAGQWAVETSQKESETAAERKLVFSHFKKIIRELHANLVSYDENFRPLLSSGLKPKRVRSARPRGQDINATLDLNLLWSLVAYKQQTDKLRSVLDTIENLLMPEVEECLDIFDRPNVRNTDRLTHEFILAMGRIWQHLTDNYPPNSRSGPFVEFLEGAWRMLGWDEFRNIPNFGKQISIIAKKNYWPLLNRLNLP